jgi:hypothetical protein
MQLLTVKFLDVTFDHKTAAMLMVCRVGHMLVPTQV